MSNLVARQTARQQQKEWIKKTKHVTSAISRWYRRRTYVQSPPGEKSEIGPEVSQPKNRRVTMKKDGTESIRNTYHAHAAAPVGFDFYDKNSPASRSATLRRRTAVVVQIAAGGIFVVSRGWREVGKGGESISGRGTSRDRGEDGDRDRGV